MSEGIKNIPDTVVTDPEVAWDIAHSEFTDAEGTTYTYSDLYFKYLQYKKVAGGALRMAVSSARPVPTTNDWLLREMRIPNPIDPSGEKVNDKAVWPFIDEIFNSGILGAVPQKFKGSEVPMTNVPDVSEVAVRASEHARGLKIRLALLEFQVVDNHELELAKKRKKAATSALLDLV